MPKCQHCGAGIENSAINYRPSTKGGYRQQSMRLCAGCVDKHDRAQEARKVLVIVIAVAGALVMIVAGVYLYMRR